MSLTLELKDKTQHVQLVEAVQQMHQTYKQPFELEQQADGTILLYGCSELDLDTILRKFIREFDIKLLAGAPQVSYRETITRKASIDYTHKKQSGGSGQFAKISLTFEPQEPGAGYAFESKVVGGSVPKEFIPGVEKGLESANPIEQAILAVHMQVNKGGKCHGENSKKSAWHRQVTRCA